MDSSCDETEYNGKVPFTNNENKNNSIKNSPKSSFLNGRGKSSTKKRLSFEDEISLKNFVEEMDKRVEENCVEDLDRTPTILIKTFEADTNFDIDCEVVMNTSKDDTDFNYYQQSSKDLIIDESYENGVNSWKEDLKPALSPEIHMNGHQTNGKHHCEENSIDNNTDNNTDENDITDIKSVVINVRDLNGTEISENLTAKDALTSCRQRTAEARRSFFRDSKKKKEDSNECT